MPWLWLDLVTLAESLRPRSELVVVRYFTAPVLGQPDAQSRQQTYLDALAAHHGERISIQLGRYQTKKKRCRSCGAGAYEPARRTADPVSATGRRSEARARIRSALPRCDWAPSSEGTHLTWQGGDKSNSASRAIRYLIDHFLKPGAKASRDGRPDFEPFTVDHVVNGIIAAYRDDGRLYLIQVDANEVRETTLVDGASGW